MLDVTNDRDRTPREILFVPWVALAAICAVMMWLTPGEETIPYHLAWIGIALAYGQEAWPWRRTIVAVTAYTAVTGGILVLRAAQGYIGWGEIAEIPLMSTLVTVVVWNVRRRHLAHATLARIAERDRVRSAQRVRFARMTSHEMRTPATIAMGYAESLLLQETDPARRVDLEVICDELNRLVRAGDRVIRTIRVHDDSDLRPHDLAVLLRDTVERWRVLADREWVVDVPTIWHVCSAERVRAVMDTLVENAVRYTSTGDTVRIFGAEHGEHLVVGVADSGPGMGRAMLESLALGVAGVDEPPTGWVAADPKSQTGLGLALVRDEAVARGGRLAAGRSAEGGALVGVAVPLVRPRHGSVPHPEVVAQRRLSPVA